MLVTQTLPDGPPYVPSGTVASVLP
jgi:hypothetical protein